MFISKPSLLVETSAAPRVVQLFHSWLALLLVCEEFPIINKYILLFIYVKPNCSMIDFKYYQPVFSTTFLIAVVVAAEWK